MIIKRNKPPKKDALPRMIVRRSKGEVGEVRPKTEAAHRIIKRSNPGGVYPIHVDVRRKQKWFPELLFGWRPGWRTYSAVTSLAVAAGLAWGGYWAWTSPYFRITDFEVSGTSVLPPETLVSATHLGGERIMTADLEAAQDRLYALPLVKSAKIEREWPHTARIIIEERTAWGTWEQSGVPYTIDREGVILGTTQPPAGSPIIRSSQQGSRQQGDRVDYQAVDAAAVLYALLPQQLGVTVTEIAYLPEKGLQVTTADGETAIFGDSSSIEYKVAVWESMATRARAEHLTYSIIDLRYGNRPVLQ